MSLDARILDHRAMYQADLHVGRLVARQPPTSLDLNTGELKQEPAAAIGMTIAGPLLRRLGHPEGYGSSYPWMKALWLLRRECRKEHPYHRAADRPYWRGSLCHQFTSFVIIGGFSVRNAAEILRYDDPETVLRKAFDFIESTIDDFRAKAEKRQRDDEGRGPGAVPEPERAHHAVPGLHMADCPKCRRGAA
jgi:hypothetical protein